MARLVHVNGATVEVADEQVEALLAAGFTQAEDDGKSDARAARRSARKSPAKAAE